GRLPGGSFYEGAGPYNQNTVDFVFEVIKGAGVEPTLAGFAVACLGLFMGALAAMACARATRERAELPPAAVVSLIVLVVWFFLFRQKPYAFETFIPFLIVAGYGAGRRTVMSAILVSIIVPSLLRHGSDVLPFPLLSTYYQLIGAWAAILTL